MSWKMYWSSETRTINQLFAAVLRLRDEEKLESRSALKIITRVLLKIGRTCFHAILISLTTIDSSFIWLLRTKSIISLFWCPKYTPFSWVMVQDIRRWGGWRWRFATFTPTIHWWLRRNQSMYVLLDSVSHKITHVGVRYLLGSSWKSLNFIDLSSSEES